jgi:hypothetical protein
MTATPQPQSCLSVPGATVDFPDRKAPPMPTATTTNAAPLSQQLLAATDTIDATNTRLDVPVPAGADWADDAFDGAGADRGRFFSHPNIAVDEVTPPVQSTSMTSVRLNVESFRSVRIEMVFCPDGPNTDTTTGLGCNGMADASAFVYSLDGRDHLVTARHNVTGPTLANGGLPQRQIHSQPDSSPSAVFCELTRAVDSFTLRGQPPLREPPSAL